MRKDILNARRSKCNIWVLFHKVLLGGWGAVWVCCVSWKLSEGREKLNLKFPLTSYKPPGIESLKRGTCLYEN